MNVKEFVEKYGITAEARRVTANPHMESMGPDARHFMVKLSRPMPGAERGECYILTVPFSQGGAHKEDPKAEDVLECLASDAAGIENASGFEDWAPEYGYSTDSRQAERIYNACREQTAELQAFLSPELYGALIHADDL